MNSSRLTQNAEHFDAIAGSVYDESIPAHIMRHLTRRRINVVRRAAGSGRVLDVGCGTGRFLSALPADVYQRFGIDVSSGMIRAAYRRDASLQCCVASGTALPHPDERFDITQEHHFA